ncbi:MAG TPA: TrmH family RNA methyltransferase [Acidimicrobiales bacterium]|jgi:tRNA (guanosine-2'-O-)-methyltransferase
MKQIDSTGLKRLHREWRRRTAGRVGLILESVESPFNVGSIIRTAAAYRVGALWLTGSTATLDSSSVKKTAMGTERFLTVTSMTKASEAIVAARDVGYTVIGVELAEGAKAMHELVLGDAVCLVVGHEDRGLTSATIDACDDIGYLPLAGKVGSLNVATATALALYEARRQEWTRVDE